MLFRSSGQLVGIGTSSPAYTLDITGSMRATGNVNATNLIGAITSSQVTTALGFTPYNSTNPSSFANSTNSLNINGTASNITGTYSGSITSSQVTTALGFTPYNNSNPAGFANSTNSVTINGNASNITAYTINQSVGSSNSPTFYNTYLNNALVLNNYSGIVWPGGTYVYADSSGNGPGDFVVRTYNGTYYYSVFYNNGNFSIPGGMTAGGNITAYYSDKRLKNINGTIQNALSKVNSLSEVIYKNNDVAAKYGYISQEEQIGVIAQEVQEVLPQIVKPAPFDTNGDGTSKSGENYTTVQYEKLVPLLIEAKIGRAHV